PPTNLRRCTLAPYRKYAKKFLTLLDELLTDIADNVTPGDLPNFRLTCKTLANIAAKQFGEKRLAYNRFIFTEYSLKGLVDMTAHLVFGPCIKSILFSTGHVTQDLMVVMNRCKHVTYFASTGVNAPHFSKATICLMLQTAFHNLLRLGTDVCLGIFDQKRDEETMYAEKYLLHGYGSARDYAGLPFVKIMSAPFATVRQIRMSCWSSNFRPKMFVYDLKDQEEYNGMRATFDLLLLDDGRIQTLAGKDICIRQGSVDIRILSSLGLVEFEQRAMIDEELIKADCCELELRCLGQPMIHALFAVPITHFRMKSCSISAKVLMSVLEAFAETLEVVELVDVVVWDTDEDEID
ncbi:hypothetical protein E4T45_09024, partial [Aureobasidium sp. EXF-8846]